MPDSVKVETCENKETCCNLDLETTPEDEKLFKTLNLSEKELRLKDENLDAFWKMISEKVRTNLSDCLEDNKELHSLKNLMEGENQDLHKENIKLSKLADESREICNEFMRENGNDSGIID